MLKRELQEREMNDMDSDNLNMKNTNSEETAVKEPTFEEKAEVKTDSESAQSVPETNESVAESILDADKYENPEISSRRKANSFVSHISGGKTPEDTEEKVTEDPQLGEGLNSYKEFRHDDPDKVPVRPSLADDEVPNMPGAILRHAREMLGLSQRMVAEKLVMRVNTVSDIENDRLNQPTALNFTREKIRDYANLVNIDPKVVVQLYEENVKEAASLARSNRDSSARVSYENETESGSGHKGLILGLCAVCLVGVGSYFFFANSSPKNEQASGALTLDNSPAEVLPSAADIASVQPEVASEPAAAASAAQEAPAPVEKADENTQRARRQALDLGSNEISHQDDVSSQVVAETDNSESLKVGESSNSPAAQPKTAAAGGFGIIPPQMEQEVNARKQAEAEKIRAEKEKAEALKKAEAEKLALAKQQEEQKMRQELKAREQELQNAQRKAEDSAAPKELSASLRDISGSVKLSGRQGLASMNSASVSVRGPVSMKITDSRGKVLAQGSYKSGDKVNVTGIPPLKISVTDSSLIRVGYMGGSVNVPASKQVSFTLPNR